MELMRWDVTQDGPLSETALRQKLERHGYHVNRYVYSPGTAFPSHSHAVDKLDAVLSGRFQLTMQGETVVLAAGDCLAIPQGVIHSATVVGPEPVVSLDGVRRT